MTERWIHCISLFLHFEVITSMFFVLSLMIIAFTVVVKNSNGSVVFFQMQATQFSLYLNCSL